MMAGGGGREGRREGGREEGKEGENAFDGVSFWSK